MQLRKCVFLDRDGVINVKAPDGDYIRKWKDFKFLPGAIEAIQVLNKNGWLTIIVTNQRGIALGLMTKKDVDNIHAKMQLQLARHSAHIDKILVCPHNKGACNCRKPNIGLFLQAESFYSIDKAFSWMIGDSESDVEAGKRFGINTIAVYNCIKMADKNCKNLNQAVQYIINL